MKRLIILSLLLAHYPSFATSMVECGHRENTVSIDQCRTEVVKAAKQEMERYYQKAKEVRRDYPEVVRALEASQTNWLDYQRNYCDSVYQSWIEGTIRGSMYLSCAYRLAKERTHNLWSDHLNSMDSTPPILPEPLRGFDYDQPNAQTSEPTEIWHYGNWSVETNPKSRGVITETMSDNSIFQILYGAKHCDNPIFMLYTPLRQKPSQPLPVIVSLIANVDSQDAIIIATPRTDTLDVGLLLFQLQPFTSLPSQLRKGDQLSFSLKEHNTSGVSEFVLLNKVSFSLKGFIASELKAKEQCERFNAN
ncbi:lysozyme inhibitor LprI family protein [Marinobacter sp. DY40_1A1]|uniref:lysozyme inhibitor LprI family protein n=1 Tax=Marinobacter sp. DY40_1A1 TaxID=2583229 RepID=UPI0019053701|nr:lysozyme inhibitor LprI family protein [Marinobacter sp. DY40_1A1]MBK1887635.1 DUF1311 domain-containing protein [Marinobacter sp. DY40_1A1]